MPVRAPQNENQYGNIHIVPVETPTNMVTCKSRQRVREHTQQSSPHCDLKVAGFTLSSLHTTTAHFFTFAFALHFLVYSSAFSICFCYPSGVSDIPTKSSANINPDTVSSPIVTPCFGASTATVMSLIHTLNRLGDSVHPSLCKPL